MIVLASASPRRKELLERAGFEFISVPAQTEEIVPEKIAVEDMPEYLAVKKAEAVLQDYPNDIILSADTARHTTYTPACAFWQTVRRNLSQLAPR